MKIRSAVPENGCLIFLVDGKKQKKTKKNICLIGGCVNKLTLTTYKVSSIQFHIKFQQDRMSVIRLPALTVARNRSAMYKRLVDDIFKPATVL